MNFRTLLVLFRNVSVVSYQKGDIILPQGSKEKYLFFIRKGLVRCYYTDRDAEETTFNLFPEYQTFANAHAVLLDEASKFSYQAIERTKVYRMDYDAFYRLANQNPKISDMNRSYLGKRHLKQVLTRMESFVLHSPEERYLEFIKKYPNLINRAPNKYIAHILGITPVSLSRIRSRLAAK